MSEGSELSKVYNQYQKSLEMSQRDYNERLISFSKLLEKRYSELLKDEIVEFAPIFSQQTNRLEIKRYAETFFGTSEINFVAIDGSCMKNVSANFVSFYGGAYGSKGVLSLETPSGTIRYNRWTLDKDVSMVAFIPIPPEMMNLVTEEDIQISQETPVVSTDYQISEVSSLHTKIMQLAEIFLAYSLAKASTTESPHFIMIDNTLCGILANSSFRPRNVGLINGDFDGESIDTADMYIALAHPFNKKLGVPSSKKFQPHFKIIAEAVWNQTRAIKHEDIENFPLENFKIGSNTLKKNDISAGSYDETNQVFTFNSDPRTSWRKTLRIFEDICDDIFRKKIPEGLTYKIKGGQRREYFLPKDIEFLIGVGIRALIELCWANRILLVGIVKDSFSRYYYRNYLGSVTALKKEDVRNHLRNPLTDRTIVELLPNIVDDLKSPWSTTEYDSCFMTLHAESTDDPNEWEIKGFNHGSAGPATRPERIFVKSLAQFFMTEDKNLASHALFIDRVIYPNWDDVDSISQDISTKDFGVISPVFYNSSNGPSRLHKLSMYLLTVLVKNHFPEALGYPDPLHLADWGAKSLKRNVNGLLESSEWAFRSNPREKLFRTIRESFKR